MEESGYTIDVEGKIIIETFCGIFNLTNYERLKSDEFADPRFSHDFNVLSDIRMTNSKFNNEDAKRLVNFLYKNIPKTGNRKCAVVTKTPQQVVFSVFFEEYSKILPVEVMTFSTVEAAMDWINH